MPNRSEKVVVIGGGANGLVVAFYLAKAGHPTLVLERRAVAGGSLVTEEIHPGFRCPTVLHSTAEIRPGILRDMQLEKYGLNPIKSDVQRTAGELEGISTRDAERYPAFEKALQDLRRVIAPMLSMTPPDVEHPAMNDYLNLARIGLKFRGLDKRNAYRLLRWAPMAIADLTREWFETESLCATIEAQGIFGAFAGPWSAGTSIGLLMQGLSRGRPVTGALTSALAKSVSAAGAEIRTGAPVTHIQVKSGGASGVVLESGEEIPAKAVVSTVDPKQTFLKLLDSTDLDPGFVAKIGSYRSAGCVAKVNLALSRLPAFRGVSGRIHIGPDTDYLERAFDAAKYGDISPRPYLDIAIPSLNDPSLAPKGSHVMSVHFQYAPYKLKVGDWNSRRDELAETVVKTIAEYAPDIRDTIVGRQILTPLDLEQIYGLTGGHIFHGEHTLDQLFTFRPILGWARYKMPVKHLYLCGSGTHPGGGMTGASGANASREIVRDLK